MIGVFGSALTQFARAPSARLKIPGRKVCRDDPALTVRAAMLTPPERIDGVSLHYSLITRRNAPRHSESRLARSTHAGGQTPDDAIAFAARSAVYGGLRRSRVLAFAGNCLGNWYTPS